jgi:hypothetical protein
MAFTKLAKTNAIIDLKKGMLVATVARKYGLHISTVNNWVEKLAGEPEPEKVFTPFHDPLIPHRVCRAITEVARVYWDYIPEVSAVVPSKRRKDHTYKKGVTINHPRAVLYLVLKDCGKSTTQIGMWFKRHHSTILHGIEAAQKRIDQGDTLATEAYLAGMEAMGEQP